MQYRIRGVPETTYDDVSQLVLQCTSDPPKKPGLRINRIVILSLKGTIGRIIRENTEDPHFVGENETEVELWRHVRMRVFTALPLKRKFIKFRDHPERSEASYTYNRPIIQSNWPPSYETITCYLNAIEIGNGTTVRILCFEYVAQPVE